MMCAYLLTAEKKKARSQFYEAGELFFNFLTRFYEKSLKWTLAHKGVIFTLLGVAMALNIYLCIIIPKGLFPQQDTGRLAGSFRPIREYHSLR